MRSVLAVCWEMFRVNSRVISGLFGDTVDCFIARNFAVSRGPDKDYVEEEGSANEIQTDKYTLDQGLL